MPPILPTLYSHYLMVSKNGELYACKRDKRIVANNQLLNLKSIVDYKSNRVFTQIPQIGKDSLGSIEINDLNDETVAYVQIPKSAGRFSDDDDSFHSSVNDANFLMDIRQASDNLITLDFNGYLREWEIDTLGLTRSLDDWQKLVALQNNSDLKVEIIKSNANENILDILNGPKHGKVDQSNAPHVGGQYFCFSIFFFS